MALNLTNIFTALGRVGRNAYIINNAQTLQGAPFTELAGYAYLNPSWLAPLAQSYDSLIRSESSPMFSWTQTALVVLQNLITAENPTYGISLAASLQFLLQEMKSQGQTVAACTIGYTTTADTANVGTGVCVLNLIRGDGLAYQNVVAEESTLLVTSDSYTGTATAGRESWQWSGSPNASSLGTGTHVGLWDWDSPQGSGAGAGGSCVSASQDAGRGQSQNYLTNGDFESWDTTGTPFLKYWYKIVGTWGTSLQRASGGLDGGFCLQLNTGATLNAISQEFGSSTSDGTNADAGTSSSVVAYTGYLGNIWLKAGGVITAGVLTISLVDGSGTVINDQAGNANTFVIYLTAHSTSWVAHPFAFRLPIVLPSAVKLKIAITTALAGATILLDDAVWTLPVSMYSGGPTMAVFSNPAAPFEAAPDPDAFTVTTTNDRGGSLYGATFQILFNRLFQTPGLILPYSYAPTIPDTLITLP